MSHGKFYFFDAGVYRALRPKGPLDRPAEIDGAALEGLVFQNLRAGLDYRGEEGGLYFWRTVSGSEVDFVVYTQDRFEAIEVKNASKVSRSDLSALKPKFGSRGFRYCRIANEPVAFPVTGFVRSET